MYKFSMKTGLIISFLALAITSSFAQKPAPPKPNIVVFLVDDMGWQDTSVPFWKQATELNRRYHTPNMERLAREGLKFTNAYAMPMLVRWPGVVKPGGLTDQYVIIEDFFPTILDIAGVKKPTVVQQVDGRSFRPLLKNPALKVQSRALVWHHPNRWIPAEGPLIHWSSGIRQGDWKLVYDHRTAVLELYSLKDDIGEQQNRATQQPDKVKQLALLLTKQLKTWKAQMPTFKKTGKPVAWPEDVIAQNKL